MLQKQGRQQFNYDVFKNAYDSDTRLQNLVKDFDKKHITLKTDETDDLPPAEKNKKDKSRENVSKMASAEVDLSDL